MKTVKASDKVFFLAEFVTDVENLFSFCKKHKIDSSNFLVVALQPEVSVFCKKREISQCGTLFCFNNDSHRRALIKSHELTCLISEKFYEKSQDPLHKICVDTFVFYARFYINHFLWILEVLKGIKEKFFNPEICVFQDDMQSDCVESSRDPFLNERDRGSVSLALKFCEENNLRMKVLTNNSKAVRNKQDKRVLIRETFLKKFVLGLYHKQIGRISRFKTVFIPFPHYNLNRLCKDIQTRFSQVLCVTSRPEARTSIGYIKLYVKEFVRSFWRLENQKRLIEIPVNQYYGRDPKNDQMEWQELKERYASFARKFQEEFVYENSSFWSEFNQKVKKDTLASLAALLYVSKAQKKFLEVLKPNLFISCVSVGEHQSWAERAQALEIPALVVPQKMLVAPVDPYAQIEEFYIGRAQVTESFRNVASQSPPVSEYLNWSGYRGNIHETGNLILSRITPEKKSERRQALFEEIGTEKKVIVWAPSMKTRRSRRFFVLETWEELLAAMEDVFDIISLMENVHLIFRIHPGSTITKSDFMTLLSFPENVSVSEDGSFEEVLSTADVLMSYSSTCIQEALVNSIPVLLYDRWKRYNHLNAYRINDAISPKISPVYYIDSKDLLESGMRWILDHQHDLGGNEALFEKYVFGKKSISQFYNFVEKCMNSVL